MHNNMYNIPQQCNNFKQNTHEFTPPRVYIPENSLLVHTIGSESFFSAIEAALPPVFSRKKAEEVLGGLISAKTLSNMDTLRTGPPKIRLSSKVGYDRAGFMAWLRNRLTSYN